MKNILFCMSAMLATATLADLPYFNNFETSVTNGWGGNLSISNVASTKYFGTPGGLSHGDGAKVLSIEGVATNENMFAEMTGSDSSTPAQVDLLVKVAAPDDELEIPEDDAGNVHIAVAVDASTNLVVYCKTNGTDVGFCTVTTAPLTSEWIRVSLNFDYEHNRCELLLNGELCTSGYGYITQTGTDTNGAWYVLANTPTDNYKPSLLKIVGTTAIDDVYADQNETGVVIDNTVADATATIDGNDVSVSKAWLYANKVSSAQMNLETQDGSGLTVGQKYLYGLEVNDGKKIDLADMQPDGSGNMKFMVPGVGSRDTTHCTFKLKSANAANANAASWNDVTTFDNNTASFNLSTMDNNVKYFKVVVED